ncbi:hypothetical protein V3W47_18885 [Deinococcus sp. YIM 134068]|uniref:hypothetical protein n=1 Tax=Deinococcus lichenicola TaxID=3118910 RepID=UPI002F93C5FD
MIGPAVLSTRRTARTRRPELALAPGPLQIGEPGAGTLADLYGCPWALALTREGPQLLQLVSGAWVARSDPDALADLEAARHVSLAFDQAARPVLAWERGGVYVRQWDGRQDSYRTRGSFVGRDPVLWCDAPLLGETSDSDVLLYYLIGSDLVSRVQREEYVAARHVATLEAGAVLDQAVSAALRLQLVGELASGARWTLATDLYPLRSADSLTGRASVAAVIEDAMRRASGADDVTGAGSVSGALAVVAALLSYGDGVTGVGSVSGTLAVSLVSSIHTHALTGAGSVSGTLAVSLVPSTHAHALTGAGAVTGALT